VSRVKLIPAFEGLDETSLHDLWIMLAKNVEDALQECGAEANEDYTRLDLFQLAQPLVTEQFRAGNLTFTKAWKS
jgi:hypothetical protein